MKMPMCRSVRLVCDKKKPLLYTYWVSVSLGSNYSGCKVAYATPSPCMVAPSTNITFSEKVDYKVKEYDRNIVVRLLFSTGHSEVFVYPRNVWDEVNTRIIEPLGKGEYPREAGLLLYGPPGTGKTSMAKILAWIHGLYRVDVRPDKILTKWLGDSEKKLRLLLDTAEANEPSIVLFDDAEWLVRPRESVTGGEDVGAFLSIMNILLETLETWQIKKRKIVAVVTTNVGEEKIEPALRRSGRLGDPIFVPLPDYEGVLLLFNELGLHGKEAEEWARKIVNAGLPMSDAVSVAKRLLAGIKPNIKPKRGRGYTRPIAPDVTPRLLNYLKNQAPGFCEALDKGSRIVIPYDATVSVPIAVLLSGALCKKPVVLLTDQRRFDEAITTADNSNAVLIVAFDYIAPDILRIIHTTMRSSVIYCGTGELPVKAFQLRIRIESDIYIRYDLVNMIADFYGVPRPNKKIMHDIGRLRDEAFTELIKSIGLYKTSIEVLRGLVAPVG